MQTDSAHAGDSAHLTCDDVQKVALLARLSFSEEQLARMTLQLEQIVTYIDQLAELATEDVQPLAHAAELHNVFRSDEEVRSLDREAALGNAPKRDDDCFLVPAVLGE